MMSTLKKVLICLVLIMAVVAITGCKQESPMERAGEAIEEAAEDTGEAIEDAGEAIEDKMEENKDKKK